MMILWHHVCPGVHRLLGLLTCGQNYILQTVLWCQSLLLVWATAFHPSHLSRHFDRL